jgi:PKD repeat protein
MMKMKSICYLLIALAFGFASCKPKELPVPTPTSPVFSASGTANGSAFLMEAGKNNYALTSLYNQNSFGVYEFQSELKPEGCSNCGGTLRISITGHAVSHANGSVYPDLSLREGDYALARAPMFTDQPYKLQFISESYPGAVYQWSFGDGQFSFDPNPVHTYQNDNQYNAKLTVSKDGYSSELIQRVKVGSSVPCGVSFDANYLGNSTWFFEDHDRWNSNNDDDFTWDIDGQFVGNGGQLQYQFEGNDEDVHRVGYRNMDIDQECPDRFYRLVTNVPGSRPCLANFYTALIPAPQTLSTVQVTYITADGREYDSLNDQNNAGNSYFVVDESVDYGSLLNGNPTRKLDIRLKAKLKRIGQSNDFVDLENVKLTMAFAYPQ